MFAAAYEPGIPDGNTAEGVDGTRTDRVIDAAYSRRIVPWTDPSPTRHRGLSSALSHHPHLVLILPEIRS